MKAFTLARDEFGTLIRFLNATKLIGMDEQLFGQFSEEDLERLTASLETSGWLAPAERPGTWNVNEDLMECLAVAIVPEFAVLARSSPHRKSVIFYLGSQKITEIVVTDKTVVVAQLESLNDLAEQVVVFLGDRTPAELIVARVQGDRLVTGRRVSVDSAGEVKATHPALLPESPYPWNEANILTFINNSLIDCCIVT